MDRRAVQDRIRARHPRGARPVGTTSCKLFFWSDWPAPSAPSPGTWWAWRPSVRWDRISLSGPCWSTCWAAWSWVSCWRSIARAVIWVSTCACSSPWGFLGAFTTFSTFGYETFRYVQNGTAHLALLNVSANLVLGLGGGLAGVGRGAVGAGGCLSWTTGGQKTTPDCGDYPSVRGHQYEIIISSRTKRDRSATKSSGCKLQAPWSIPPFQRRR